MDLAGLPGSPSCPAQLDPRKVKGRNVQFGSHKFVRACVCVCVCVCVNVNPSFKTCTIEYQSKSEKTENNKREEVFAHK